ncbi:MAG: porin [Pseudomonadota bacterium]
MKLNHWGIVTLTALLPTVGILAEPAQAGMTVYEEGEKYLKIGGRIQLQYHYEDPDGGEKTDELFFRRLRPYIEGSLYKDWKGKIQWDMGKAGDSNEIAVKDAYLQYMGFSGLKLTVGNAKIPFSREFLTSSKKQQLVERTFVGDHNYGTPDRSVGIHVTGHNESKNLTFGASIASASIDPDNKKLDFDSPINKNSDFNEGWIYGGRIDFHPFGKLKFSQGDFKREMKATIGLAAFQWSNDDDVSGVDDAGNDPAKKADVDKVTGYEISAAFRAAGLSIDAQYNLFDSELVQPGITSGLYKNSGTDLENWAVEGGYMVLPSRLEIVAGYQWQDADNYDEEWTRISFGANWFLHKHDIKLQATYRISDNKDGQDGKDEDELFVQAQYVF